MPAVVQLPLLLLAREATGSYFQAGLALGAYAGASAATAPARGRALDTRGPRRALPPMVVVHSSALVLLPVASAGRAGWAIVCLAGIAGLVAPPLATAMRVEWQQRLAGNGERLPQAYAFESVVQVTLFLVGPLLAAGGIAMVGARATVVVVAVAGGMAGLAFARLSASVAPAEQRLGRLGVIRLPGVQTLVLATVLADASLGIVDVVVPAFALRHGQENAAGLLLAAFAASSAAGGAVYGARRWSWHPVRRLVALMLAGAGGVALLALAQSVLGLGLLLVIAGAPFTAQWATTSIALDAAAPASAQAEAYTWLVTANGVGIALGSVVGGYLVDASGPALSFLVAAASVAGAGGAVALRQRTLAG